MISISDVSFSYRIAGTELPVLRSIGFDVAPGETVAVLGANGSGKSTLAQLVNGLLLPDSGTVSVDGLRTDDVSRTREIRELVAVVMQHPDDQIVATAVEDDVAFGPENLGLPRAEIRQRVDSALDAVGLVGLERREPHLLSGGQKQRLAIAGALAMQPRYLVLDEPTSMLDPEGRRDVADVVAAVGRTGCGVLLVTHDLGEAGHADRVVVLERGAIAFTGTTKELVKLPDLLGRCGVEEPPLSALVGRLGELGTCLPEGLYDPEGLVDALCR